jgi:hypothetical protein
MKTSIWIEMTRKQLARRIAFTALYVGVLAVLIASMGCGDGVPAEQWCSGGTLETEGAETEVDLDTAECFSPCRPDVQPVDCGGRYHGWVAFQCDVPEVCVVLEEDWRETSAARGVCVATCLAAVPD